MNECYKNNLNKKKIVEKKTNLDRNRTISRARWLQQNREFSITKNKTGINLIHNTIHYNWNTFLCHLPVIQHQFKELENEKLNQKNVKTTRLC